MGMRTRTCTYMRMKNGIENCTCTQCIQVVCVYKCIMYINYYHYYEMQAWENEIFGGLVQRPIIKRWLFYNVHYEYYKYPNIHSHLGLVMGDTEMINIACLIDSIWYLLFYTYHTMSPEEEDEERLLNQ